MLPSLNHSKHNHKVTQGMKQPVLNNFHQGIICKLRPYLEGYQGVQKYGNNQSNRWLLLVCKVRVRLYLAVAICHWLISSVSHGASHLISWMGFALTRSKYQTTGLSLLYQTEHCWTPDWDRTQPLRLTEVSLTVGDTAWRQFTKVMTRTMTLGSRRYIMWGNDWQAVAVGKKCI